MKPGPTADQQERKPKKASTEEVADRPGQLAYWSALAKVKPITTTYLYGWDCTEYTANFPMSSRRPKLGRPSWPEVYAASATSDEGQDQRDSESSRNEHEQRGKEKVSRRY